MRAKLAATAKRTGAAYTNGSNRFGELITRGVGTMTCAYLFACISLTSLPSTLKMHSINADVQWVAQTFLQLVLLSVIIVGQNIQAASAERRDIETHDAVMEELRMLHAKFDADKRSEN